MDEILKQLTIEYLEAVEDRCSLLFQALNVKNKFELGPNKMMIKYHNNKSKKLVMLLCKLRWP